MWRMGKFEKKRERERERERERKKGLFSCNGGGHMRGRMEKYRLF